MKRAKSKKEGDHGQAERIKIHKWRFNYIYASSSVSLDIVYPTNKAETK